MVSNIASSAEQLYTDQPPVTPELAFPGTYDVGVTTITATDPKRLNTSNFITSSERPSGAGSLVSGSGPQRRNNGYL
jgi:hypothetical protein